MRTHSNQRVVRTKYAHKPCVCPSCSKESEVKEQVSEVTFYYRKYYDNKVVFSEYFTICCNEDVTLQFPTELHIKILS